jgi:hypothetical protein
MLSGEVGLNAADFFETILFAQHYRILGLVE